MIVQLCLSLGVVKYFTTMELGGLYILRMGDFSRAEL